MADFDSMVDDSATAAPQAPAAIPTPQAAVPHEAAPDFDTMQSDEDVYGSPRQIARTVGLGVLEGAAGPLGTAAAKAHSGEEEVKGLRETNPIAHGVGQAIGLGASLFTGEGLGSAAAKAGEAVRGLTGLGEGAGIAAKIGAEAIDQAAQMALIQGSDEISKMIIHDPESTAQNAIGHIGLAAGMGGLTGAAIGSISPLWKAAGFGEKASKFAQEFKDELKFIHENPEPVMAASQELEALHNNTQALKESLYSNGVKGDLIREHFPESTPKNIEKINTQVQEVSDKLSETIESMSKNKKASGQSKYLEQDLIDFQEKVTNPNAGPLEKREAMNDLRKELHTYTKWDRLGTTEGTELSKYARQVNESIMPMLEDQAVWGKAGKVQETFNKAFSEFTNSKAEKDFLKTFTNEVAGERILNPAKIDTFARQAGSPKVEIKNEILQNYIAEHSKFAEKINKVMGELGKDPLVPPPSLGMLNKLMGEKTAGAELAQKLVQKLGDNVAGKVAGGSIGGALGSLIGHPGLGFIAGEHALSPMLGSVFNGLTKNIMESGAMGAALNSSINFSMAAAKGAQVLNKAAANVLKPGVPVLASHIMPDFRDREKLDKVVTKMQDNPDAMTKINNGNLGHYQPGHQVALTETQTRAIDYLQHLKPQPFKSSPLDKEVPPTKMAIARYNRALDIAQQPSIVLHHIKEGTIQTSDIQDLQAMYPSLYKQMSAKLTDQIMSKEADNETVPYKVRMGISLFLAQPMDSTMLPSSIMAAQPIPKAPPQQQQAKGSEHKGTNSLGKSTKSYQTPLQASESDRANRD